MEIIASTSLCSRFRSFEPNRAPLLGVSAPFFPFEPDLMALQPSAASSSSSSAAAAARRLAPSSLLLPQHRVEHYGKPSQLECIAQISTPDGSSLLMQPYDKSCLKAIEKAILNSDIGLTPNNDGEVIRLSISQLISERRKELLTV